MATIRSLKLLNGGFEKWRMDGYDYEQPYEWGLGYTGFGSQYVTRESSQVNEGDYSLKCINIGASTEDYRAHIIRVQNLATKIYTLSFDWRVTAYEAPSPCFIAFASWDEDMTSLIGGDTAIRYFNAGGGPINTWNSESFTFAGAGGGSPPDFAFHADLIALDFYLYTYGGGSTIYLDGFEFLGESITLEKGGDLPILTPDRYLQKGSLTASGDVLARASYGAKVEKVILNLSRMRKDDYDSLYAFFESSDIDFNNGVVRLTDDLGNTYDAIMVQDQTALLAEFNQGVRGRLEFQVLPY